MTYSAFTSTICLLLAFAPPVTAATSGNTELSPSSVIAEVNGKKITWGEFQQSRADKLFQAQNTYYQAEHKVLDEYLQQYLLRQEAEKEGVTVEQLLERHAYSTLPKDPTDEALRVYYEGLDTNDSFEAVRGQILDHIRENRQLKAKAAYLQQLRQQARISITLPPPRADVAIKNAPVRGVADAPVVVIEFADYECPYCQQIEPELKKLEAEYNGKIAFAFKDSPLPMHPHAEKAAEAASCAGVQGKFWEYHDLLFASKQYELPDLKKQARTLGLDGKAFDLCLDSGQRASAVKGQLAEAEQLGLSGTPVLFINGRFLNGLVDYSTLRGVVAEEIATASGPKERASR